MRALALIFLFLCTHYQAQILNAYARVSNISGTTLTVINVNQSSHTFNVGEKVLIMQMQDNVIGTNTVSTSAAFGNLASIANAGRYEFGIISARSPATGIPTSITLATALANTYNTGVNSSVQLVSFRNMGTNYTSSAPITGLAWDGNVGGIICFEVGNTLTLQHNISADGIGFIGGARSSNFYSACENSTYAATIGNRYAGKGEGIYNSSNTAFDGARGKIINGGGGGNDVNGGGAGGGNYSAGGEGGIGWVPAGTGCVPTVGGVGGLGLSGQISATRVFMGGGGGGGHQNDNVGSTGGNGGGIILIKAARLVSGSCSNVSITAHGLAAANAINDGAGGGGAAGSIVLQIPTYSITSACPLVIAANGGNGGSSVTTGVHGGGAGGGQGVLVFSSPQPTANVTAGTAAGIAGTSCAGCPVASNPTNGGGPANAGIITSSSGPLPVELLSFDGTQTEQHIWLYWSSSSEKNNDRYIVERSPDAIHFTGIGSVKAAGNSTTSRHYELYDHQPLQGINYYRLKQLDTDGSFSYSHTIAFSYENALSMSLFPNPASETEAVFLSVDKISTSRMEVEIFDASGKLISFSTVIPGDKPIKILDSKPAKGIYTVRVITGTATLVKKLVIY